MCRKIFEFEMKRVDEDVSAKPSMTYLKESTRIKHNLMQLQLVVALIHHNTRRDTSSFKFCVVNVVELFKQGQHLHSLRNCDQKSCVQLGEGQHLASMSTDHPSTQVCLTSSTIRC